jgi:hypothetical protein
MGSLQDDDVEFAGGKATVLQTILAKLSNHKKKQ